MTFHYSTKRLVRLFIIRLIPIIPFLVLAVGLGEVFWVPVAIFLLEALFELYWNSSKGYFTIADGKLKTHHLFQPKSIQIEDIYLMLSYNYEWTFRTKDKEIRINESFIAESEREFFQNEWSKIREKVDAKKEFLKI